jgi:phage shock protein B
VFVLFRLFISRRSKKETTSQLLADDTAELEVLHKDLSNMIRRVESLETILRERKGN